MAGRRQEADAEAMLRTLAAFGVPVEREADAAAALRAEWTGENGGAVLGTLPFLAAFLDEPFEPSPYGPASRLHWNELFLDVAEVPELAGSEEARRLLASAEVEREVRAVRTEPLVDY